MNTWDDGDDAVLVTDGDVDTGDVAGIDVREGWYSNDDVSGLGANIDAMPGDELPVTQSAMTEQDRDNIRLNTVAEDEADEDLDGGQTAAASSKPLL